MIDIPTLIEYDKELLLKLNGSDTLFLDGFMWFATTTYIWMPTALALLFVIFKNNDVKTSIFTIIAIALVILAADQISSGIFKPLFHRWRPAQDPEMMYLVDIVRGYRGGRFGFISSHAANTFAVSTFIYLLIRRKSVLFIMLSWACLCSYSRIYLGVHFPGDILAGALVGVLCGIAIYYPYSKIFIRNHAYSEASAANYYTNKYQANDASIIYFTFLLNLLLIAILSLMLSSMF